MIRLEVDDDGRGATPDELRSTTGHGLVGMRERVEGLGGELTFISNGPGGTCVNVKLPIL